MTEQELLQKERELQEREQALEARERENDKLENKPFSKAFQEKKEDWFDHVPLTVHQLDIIIGIAVAALAVVIVLIVLEAAGIFKL